MEPVINSFLLVAFAEVGDKTQLLSLILVTQFKKPWPIILGILIATLFNHLLAAWVGSFSSHFIPENIQKWILASVFLFFSVWVLFPDKKDGLKTNTSLGAFLTTLVSFFLVEMGDKTQLATVALGAQYKNFILITFGTTLGLLAANIPAVFLGEKILQFIPLKLIRILASILFLIFMVFVLMGRNPFTF